MAEQRTLRSKQLRGLLWRAADGKCQFCGGQLDPDDWHADHIVPYSKTKRTNVFEMQALCPRCNLRKGSTNMDWKSILQPKAHFQLRRGQKDAFGLAITNNNGRMLLVLPTGYGKTAAALGIYAILRQRGIVNRLLWFVPQDEQRRQAANAMPSLAKELGVPLREVFIVEKDAREFAYHQRNIGEVFIATYHQTIYSDQYFEHLLKGGIWMIVYDECHHLAETGKWGPASHELPSAFRLYMSATPVRSDRISLIGVPTQETTTGALIYNADVEITYPDAIREQVIKRPLAHIEHYYVDIEMSGQDGIMRLDTQALRDAGITTQDDLTKYEAKKELRYCDTYLSRMISDSLTRLAAKNIEHPNCHQCLVFAMTCRHAETLARHYNLIEKGCADWVGINRKDVENRNVLDRYRANKLPVLVQVDKAGEGFDNDRTSVLVFLHLIKAPSKLLQQIGRGLRRNYAIEPYGRDICDIFASADTDIACQVQTLAVDCDEYRSPELNEEEGAREAGLDKIPDIAVIMAEWFRTDEVKHGHAGPEATEYQKQVAAKYGIPVEALIDYEAGRPTIHPTVAQEETEQQRRKRRQQQVDKACSVLAHNVVKYHSLDGEFQRESLGEVKRTIHSKWIDKTGVNTKAMLSDDFIQKYEWIQELNERLRAGDIPLWLKL